MSKENKNTLFQFFLLGITYIIAHTAFRIDYNENPNVVTLAQWISNFVFLFGLGFSIFKVYKIYKS